MTKFRVIDCHRIKGSRIEGVTLEENLSSREALRVYLKYQGRSKGRKALKGSANLLKQDAPNSYEVEQ